MNEADAFNIISHIEDEHTERKRAENGYSIQDVFKYTVALANEGGGHLILGVDDGGDIIGTKAFSDINQLKHNILSQPKISRRIRIEVDVFFLTRKSRRVLILTIPPRPRGEPVGYDGCFLMRSGESLVGMNVDMLQDILNEDSSDFSSEIIDSLSPSDLDPEAIEIARYLWLRKTGNEAIEMMTPQEVVTGLGLGDENGISRAAVILLGKESAVSKYVSNSETVWEYRKSNTEVEYVSRSDYKKGFLTYSDDLWNQISARNDVAHISDGFFVKDIPAFDEKVIRESILNAITHRDYQDQGSVYIRQSSEELIIESPGGFPDGITAENIMCASSKPRNRLIAEVFQKLGLVERSGQGVDKIFMITIAFGKGQPSYSGSSKYEVKLTVGAQIQDIEFIHYLDNVSRETGIKLSAKDYVLLEKVRLGDIRSMSYDSGLARLCASGLVEKSKNGRYARPMLAKRFYSELNKRGEYTRQRGLDKEQKIMLIIKHLEHYRRGYIDEIDEALGRDVKRSTLNNYLKNLQNEGKIEFIGNKHIGRGPERGFWQLKK